MPAYYNENDPSAAAWLAELIRRGLIADGPVDTRSIKEVQPDDLREFTQCHFFAGIGVWSYALRSAGWPDDRPVWTGSCPCQPFSAAGKRAAQSDDRHLWPSWFWLIRECRPHVVFGEQVEAAVRHGWLDDLSADLEGEGYAVGAAVLGAHSVGAPHIRQRLYWVAESEGQQHNGRGNPRRGRGELADRGVSGGLADTGGSGLEGRADGTLGRERAAAERTGGLGGVADHAIDGRREERPDARGLAPGDRAQGLSPGSSASGGDHRPNAPPSFWRDPDWLYCRDGRWRPVESGTFPLAHGAPARMGRLRGYGNAICAPTAETFIRAYCDLTVPSDT